MRRVTFRDIKCPVCGKVFEEGLIGCRETNYQQSRLDGYTEGLDKYADFFIQCPACHYFFTDPERKPESKQLCDFVNSEVYQRYFQRNLPFPKEVNDLGAKIALYEFKGDQKSALSFRRLQLWYIEDMMKDGSKEYAKIEETFRHNLAEKFASLPPEQEMSLLLPIERLEYIDILRQDENYKEALVRADRLLNGVDGKETFNHQFVEDILYEMELIMNCKNGKYYPKRP